MAGENSIQVTISNGGLDLTAYLTKLQQQATETNRKLQDDAKVQNKLAQDQLKLLHDQIDELTKLSNLEIAMARRRSDYNREQRQAEMELRRLRSHQTVPGISMSTTDTTGVGKVDWSYSSSRQNMGLDDKNISGGAEQFDSLLRGIHDNTDAITNAAQRQVSQMTNDTTSIVAAIEAVKDEVGKLGELIPDEVECTCEGSDAGGGNGGGSDAADAELQRRYNRRYPMKGLQNAISSTLTNPDTYTQLASFAAKHYSAHANAENSFQTIASDTEAAYGIGGGAAGAVIGSFFGMPVLGAQLGYSLGSTFGAAKGEQDQKEAISKQEFEALVNKLNGFTGHEMPVGVPRLSQYGVDAFQSAQLMEQVALKGGMSNAARNTEDVVTVNKAFNVGQNELMSLIELQGTNKEGNDSLKDLVSGLILKGEKSGILKRGDYSGLGDYITKFSTLHYEFLKNQTQVGTATTADVMGKFNGVGGMFSMTDPRGMNNVMAVQDGLQHPGSESMKAFSFMALRKLDPNASMFDLMEMQEQGLSSKKGMQYMQSIVKTAHTIGNDDDGRQFIKDYFPGLSYTAARELYDKSDKLNGVTDQGYLEQLKLKVPFGPLAAMNTTQMERETAQKKDEDVKGMAEMGTVVGDKMAEAFVRYLGGTSISMQNGTLEPGKSAQQMFIAPAPARDKTMTANAYKDSMRMALNPIVSIPHY